jgi:cytochrome P450
VASYALPLPTRVICALLGVPDGDRDQIRQWSDTLFAAPVDASAVAEVLAARSALRGYLADLLAAKRRDPGDDLLSALCVRDDRLTDDELVATGVLLLVAGHETAAGLISSATLRLLACPEHLAAVRRDRALLAPAVEESLRLDGAVVLGVVRYTRQETTVAGVRIPAGQSLLLCTPAANRDPARFPDAGTLDLTRGDNAHLSFGHGPHFCLGAQLARVQMRALFGELLRRTAAVEFDGPPALLRSNFQRGVKRLPVRWSAGE